MSRNLKWSPLAIAVAGLAMTGGLHAQDDVVGDDNRFGAIDDPEEFVEDRQEAEEIVTDAIEVVEQMKRDPELMQLMDRAAGIFIIPDYGQAGFIVGGEGGEGVIMLREGGKWSPPAFFNFGGVTVGAVAGVEAGAVAMLLMSDEATEQFKMQENDFSLDASAGLSIIDWSRKAEASAGRGDIVVWSDTEGAFAGLTIGVSDINQDEDENAAFYGPGVGAAEILSGNVEWSRAEPLRDALTS